MSYPIKENMIAPTNPLPHRRVTELAGISQRSGVSPITPPHTPPATPPNSPTTNKLERVTQISGGSGGPDTPPSTPRPPPNTPVSKPMGIVQMSGGSSNPDTPPSTPRPPPNTPVSKSTGTTQMSGGSGGPTTPPSSPRPPPNTPVSKPAGMIQESGSGSATSPQTPPAMPPNTPSRALSNHTRNRRPNFARCTVNPRRTTSLTSTPIKSKAPVDVLSKEDFPSLPPAKANATTNSNHVASDTLKSPREITLPLDHVLGSHALGKHNSNVKQPPVPKIPRIEIITWPGCMVPWEWSWPEAEAEAKAKVELEASMKASEKQEDTPSTTPITKMEIVGEPHVDLIDESTATNAQSTASGPLDNQSTSNESSSMVTDVAVSTEIKAISPTTTAASFNIADTMVVSVDNAPVQEPAFSEPTKAEEPSPVNLVVHVTPTVVDLSSKIPNSTPSPQPQLPTIMPPKPYLSRRDMEKERKNRRKADQEAKRVAKMELEEQDREQRKQETELATGKVATDALAQQEVHTEPLSQHPDSPEDLAVTSNLMTCAYSCSKDDMGSDYSHADVLSNGVIAQEGDPMA